MKVLIAHVPYQVWGGEDAHVGELHQAYQRLGWPVALLPQERNEPWTTADTVRSLSPVDLKSKWQEEIESFAPDLIHLHNAFPLLGPAFFRWVEKKRIPLLMTVHNHRFYCTNGLALRAGKVCKDCLTTPVPVKSVVHRCNGSLSKVGYHFLAMSQMRTGRLYERAVTRFVAPSPYIADELVRAGMPREKVSQVLNPVDAPKTVTEGDANRVCFAGRLSEEKGIRFFLEAIRLCPQIHFEIAGTGPLQGEVEKAANEMKHLRYLGRLEKAEVQALIARSRIGVLTSICNEVLPTFVLECFANGKRCLVPDRESTRWLAEQPWGGRLANPEDPQALAQGIQDLVRAPLLSDLERAKVVDLLSPSRFEKSISKICQELVIA